MLAAVDDVPRRPALRYHGGKFRLAPWILSHMPAHQCYVEPFGGAAGVLLQKPRSYAEVYNDLDDDVVTFFRVVRDPALRERLIEACQLTPYARTEFDLAYQHTDDLVERARRTAVRAMMGFGSAGATKGVTGFRVDTRREYGTSADNWSDYPECLSVIGRRFERVIIENRPAVDVMRQHDAADVLHFVDPPYVHDTRELRSKGGYRHEMSDADHGGMLDCLTGLKGMVMLCGYPSPLYADRLGAWHQIQRNVAASGGRGSVKRIECLWMNPACHAAWLAGRGDLFAAGAQS